MSGRYAGGQAVFSVIAWKTTREELVRAFVERVSRGR